MKDKKITIPLNNEEVLEEVKETLSYLSSVTIFHLTVMAATLYLLFKLSVERVDFGGLSFDRSDWVLVFLFLHSFVTLRITIKLKYLLQLLDQRVEVREKIVFYMTHSNWLGSPFSPHTLFGLPYSVLIMTTYTWIPFIASDLPVSSVSFFLYGFCLCVVAYYLQVMQVCVKRI